MEHPEGYPESYIRDKICPICGYTNWRSVTQCHYCLSEFDNRSSIQKLAHKFRIFKRLNELELKNKKLYAALAKACKSIEELEQNEQL